MTYYFLIINIFLISVKFNLLDTVPNDIIIWDSFRQGNKEALALLFKRHYAELFRYGLKMSIEKEMIDDTLQDLFIEIWQQKTPPPVLSIKAYLIKSLRYKLLKVIKKAIASKMVMKAPDDIFDIGHEAFLMNCEQDKENVNKVLNCLQKLPPRQKEIIYLRYYLKLDYKEICEVMNIEYQVARNQLSNAIKNMKRGLLLLLINLLVNSL